MLRISLMAYGSGFARRARGASKRLTANTAVGIDDSASGKRSGSRRKKTTETENVGKGRSEANDGTSTAPSPSSSRKRTSDVQPVSRNVMHASTSAFRSRHSEEEVMQLAQRMQRRDLTGDVPVASFAYEVLKVHPSVRQMGLRERMGFLCDRWERLSERQRRAYLDDPLKGLL